MNDEPGTRVDAHDAVAAAEPERSLRVHHAVGVRSGGIAADLESAGDLPGAGIESDHLLPKVLNHPHGVVASSDIPWYPRQADDPSDLSRSKRDAHQRLIGGRDPGGGLRKAIDPTPLANPVARI
jgi:hypothetical protein